jgi:hypothetical protein
MTSIISGRTTPSISKVNPIIKMERSLSYWKWLWTNLFQFGTHFLGFLGENNDINVLDQTPMIYNLLNGMGREFDFVMNRTT